MGGPGLRATDRHWPKARRRAPAGERPWSDQSGSATHRLANHTPSLTAAGPDNSCSEWMLLGIGQTAASWPRSVPGLANREPPLSLRVIGRHGRLPTRTERRV